jgi:hypothetical protein
MASIDWLYAALVGVGGSVLGGIVGGWFALRAVHQQWDHERETSRLDRSHQAAATAIAGISELERAIVAWQKGEIDADALREAKNFFEVSILVPITALTDADLSNRVGNHRKLVWRLDEAVRKQPTMARALSETVRYDTDVVVPALQAHIRDEPLPSYEAPPLDDAVRLLTWGRHPEGGG